MRDWVRLTCLAMLVCSACGRPAAEGPQIQIPPIAPPEASLDPGLPGCPALRVFADAEDLCRRGIMPMHPFGRCERLAPNIDTDNEPGTLHVEQTQIAALGGQAELFVKGYIGSGDSGNETYYLALQRANGYVLLASVANFESQGNDAPTFEHFAGDATSVEVRILQEWWNLDDDATTFSEFRRTSVRCTLDETGDLRCDGSCPDLALANTPPELDCAALASVAWSQLPNGQDASEDWSGRFADDQLMIARRWMGLAAEWEQPVRVRTVDVERQELTILELEAGRWALLHDQVPLLASESEIRVGPAPDGVYVSSESGGQRRVHRLHIATHELEPVIPGPCG